MISVPDPDVDAEPGEPLGDGARLAVATRNLVPAREEELGLKFGRPGTSAAEPAEVDPEERDLPNQSEEQAA